MNKLATLLLLPMCAGCTATAALGPAVEKAAPDLLSLPTTIAVGTIIQEVMQIQQLKAVLDGQPMPAIPLPAAPIPPVPPARHSYVVTPHRAVSLARAPRAPTLAHRQFDWEGTSSFRLVLGTLGTLKTEPGGRRGV